MKQRASADPATDTATLGWQLLDQIRRFRRVFDHRWRTEVSDTVTATQFRVLRAVAIAAAADQNTIAGMGGVDTSTAGAVIDRLVKRGLLARATDPADRRRVVLELTAAGHVQHDQLVAASNTLITSLMACPLADQLASAPALQALADTAAPRSHLPRAKTDPIQPQRTTP